ncbi:MAG TPA: Ig-like domain-containing protein [Saprospiraceae bacterium]|nr:Ig-like domain-containing protein [Saprospiraceae bacterium]
MPNTSFIRFTLYFICGLFILSCKSKVPTNEPNPYIFANTSGIISKTDPIKVIFAGNMVEPKAVGGYITSGAFSISPSVEGKAVWQDEKTLVFKPTKELESNKEYNISIQLSDLQDNIPTEYKKFNFSVKTIRQDAIIVQAGWDTPSAADFRIQTYKGSILLADSENNIPVEAMLKAEIEGQTLPIVWQHTNNGLNHNFTITDIQRNNRLSKLTIAFNGKPIHIETDTKSEIDVVPVSDFKVHDLYYNNEDDFYFTVNFTDPILATQDLSGLITIDGYVDPITYSIQNNNIKVYP